MFQEQEPHTLSPQLLDKITSFYPENLFRIALNFQLRKITEINVLFPKSIYVHIACRFLKINKAPSDRYPFSPGKIQY